MFVHPLLRQQLRRLHQRGEGLTDIPEPLLAVVAGSYRELEGELRAARVAVDTANARNRELEQRLTQAIEMEERLRISDRMASLGTMAAGVAHEINNPLSYVLGNLEHVIAVIDAMKPAPSTNRIREAISEAYEGALRVRRIVRDLKTFSHPGSEDEEVFDVHAVLESAIAMTSNEIRHRAILRREYELLPPVRGESSRLAQVFLNLLINAVQALPVGDAQNQQIRISTKTFGQEVIIEVTDSGCGVSARVIGRIFEPFVTTKPAGVGTGLGLSICRSIVTAMGGTIEAERRRPRGTTVRVRLPSTERPMSAATAPLPPIEDSLPARILIVDDDPLVAKSLRRLLNHHRVETVTSGRQALDRLLEDADYDIILCDLMMPEVTGMDIFAEITGIRPDLIQRFVFMTGGAFTPTAREFMRAVNNPILEKPFSRVALEEVLTQRVAPHARREG